jgi:hypothetical protein
MTLAQAQIPLRSVAPSITTSTEVTGALGRADHLMVVGAERSYRAAVPADSETVGATGTPGRPTEERLRWNTFKRALDSDPASLGLTAAQAGVVTLLWSRFVAACPTIGYPTVSGELGSTAFVAWRPEHFTLEIEIDAEGNTAWFFKNLPEGLRDGGDFASALPERIFSYAKLFGR